MDPFEEFEFKPLTDGLGFHNRTQNAPAAAPKRDDDFQFNMNSMDIQGDYQTPIQAPLPRKDETQIRARTSYDNTTNAKVEEILKTLGERRKFDFAEPETAKGPSWSASRPEISAALLDGMLIIAAYLGAMIVMLVATKVDLFANLLNPDEDRMIYLSLVGIFAGISWIYLVANRIFLGFTPGEWVFDQRLGLPHQVGSAGYSMKVAVRAFAVVATGMVPMTLISAIARQDLMGKIVGVQLMKKV